jgi:hypothetical protein
MMMMRRMSRVALALATMAAGSTSVEAAGPGTTTDPDTGLVRVVNNFVSPVRVYAEDAEGRIHLLGRLARGQLKAFAIPDEIARLGAFRVRVYPHEPFGSWGGDERGIKTRPLRPSEEGSVTVWLETDLADSTIQVGNG